MKELRIDSLKNIKDDELEIGGMKKLHQEHITKYDKLHLKIPKIEHD